MVLIVTDFLDQSVNDFIDWLLFYKKKYLVIQNIDVIEIEYIDVNKMIFQLIINGNEKLNSQEVEFFIYRKGYLNVNINIIENNLNPKEFSAYLENEVNKLQELIFYILQKKVKNYFGDYFLGDTNKLFYLLKALEYDLKIPETLICNNKSSLVNFYNIHNKKIITKSISECYSEIKDGYLYYNYTSSIEDDSLSIIKEDFFYSLFQNKIIKDYEIRVFFIYDTFFSLALFYGNDIDDYRENYNKIECMAPINLPNEVLEKLKHFTKKNNFTTGSIDMMFSNNEYYFLEINPNGQFGFVSNIYNISIEKIIIDSLLFKV
jgi:hypothetical protein